MAWKKRTAKIYDAPELYQYAIGALARQMRTVAEIKRLMRNKVGKQPDAEVLIEAVVIRLKEHHYLNDSNYAATFSSFRRENEKFGPMRVVQDLKAKGVHGDVIEKAVTSAYEGVNEEQLARDFLARKRLKKPADQKQAARIFRALMRAGFSSRVIFTILKNWDVEDETLSELEQEQLAAEERIQDDES